MNTLEEKVDALVKKGGLGSEELLLEACENGNLKMVKYLLTSDDVPFKPRVSVDLIPGSTQSCYHKHMTVAAKNGHTEICEFIHNHKDWNKHNGIYYLYKSAIANNRIDTVKRFLEIKAPSYEGDGWYCDNKGLGFWIACQMGYNELIELLLTDERSRKTFTSRISMGIIKAYYNNNYETIDLIFKSKKISQYVNIEYIVNQLHRFAGQCKDEKFESFLECYIKK